MEEFEIDLENLLLGQPLPVTDADERLDVKDLIHPKTKKNIGYIVAGVFINEAGQVLMIQEAKTTCYGTWYLPAGRMEPGEDLHEAVIREVEEEAGLKCAPSTLLSIEVGSGAWYRFTFTGQITGGRLKTLEKKDKESLQAEWIDYQHIKNKQVQIRAGDIIHLIDLAFQHRGLSEENRHRDLMPSIQPQHHLKHRSVIVHKNNGALHVLVNTSNDVLHIPASYMSPYDFSSLIAVFAIMNTALQKEGKTTKPKLCGLLSLEFTGKPKWSHDGICMTSLVLLESPILPPLNSVDYLWHPVIKTEIKDHIDRLIQKGMCVPILNIH